MQWKHVLHNTMHHWVWYLSPSLNLNLSLNLNPSPTVEISH